MQVLIRLLVILAAAASVANARSVHLRVNQAGYLPGDEKIAIVFADGPVSDGFVLKDVSSGKSIVTGTLRSVPVPEWGSPFSHYYTLDMSSVRAVGRYRIELSGGETSREFSIGEYPGYHEDLLFFMRQQRCGYN